MGRRHAGAKRSAMEPVRTLIRLGKLPDSPSAEAAIESYSLSSALLSCPVALGGRRRHVHCGGLGRARERCEIVVGVEGEKAGGEKGSTLVNGEAGKNGARPRKRMYAWCR
jgi:hypothetical protein